MSLEQAETISDLQQLMTVRDSIEGLFEAGRDASAPRADLIDAGDSYRLVIEVPGMSEESLEIALQDGELVVAGVREPQSEDTRYLLSERQAGPFQRAFPLPGPVRAERTGAHLQQGLLVVVLPKE